MNKPSFDLKQTTAWMMALIRYPAGVGQGAYAKEAPVESLLVSSEQLSAQERLAIYQGAYHYRLQECLQAQFPVLLHFLEEELFAQFAMDYLDAYPSKSYALQHLGAKFAGHLADTRPDKDLPLEERESWPDFIIELARLEYAFYEIYDGPGAEKTDLLSVDKFRKLEDQGNLRLNPVPCLQLFASQYPVHHYFREVRLKQEAELPLPAATYLIITRENYVVRFYEIDELQYRFLSALLQDNTIASALENINLGEEQALDFVQAWIRQALFLDIS